MRLKHEDQILKLLRVRFGSQIVRTERIDRARGRARKYRCPIEPDDLVAEFNLGVAKALQTVRPDIGNPFEYLISRGFLHLKMVMRAEGAKHIIEECIECHNCRPYRQAPCPRCGGRAFAYHPRFVSIDTPQPCAKPGVRTQIKEETTCLQIA